MLPDKELFDRNVCVASPDCLTGMSVLPDLECFERMSVLPDQECFERMAVLPDH